MSPERHNLELYRDAACGREDAFLFLMAAHDWCHQIDDDIDVPGRDRLNVVDRCMEGVVLCSSAFYMANRDALRLALALVADDFRTSVRCERGAPELLALGDVLRLSGNHLVLAVAFLCGGWRHMNAISDRLWPHVWANQHPLPTVIA
jgi:hypothetical protein